MSDDDPTTLPPIPIATAVAPRPVEQPVAVGDFRYHHTLMTVGALVDGWEVAMLAESSAAHFHLDCKLAARVAAELETGLRRCTSLPRLFDAQGRPALPPAPPPAPESAYYSPFPTICEADRPVVHVQFATSRIFLLLLAPEASVHITVDEAVAAWLYTLLTGAPPRLPPS